MADKSITERLQPSLLDRLTDDAPDSAEESADAKTINVSRLRDIIRRDLSWLLNASNNMSEIDPELFPRASASTLNYGVEEAAGDFSNGERLARVRASIERAITLYEPRIQPDSLEIELKASEHSNKAVVEFEIHANMWAKPLPQELYLRSLVDLATGEVQFE